MLCLALLPVAPTAASHSPSHFAVRKQGSSYVAESQTKTYTGALKSVVESAVSDLNAGSGGTVTFQSGVFDLGSDYFRLKDVYDITFEGQGIDVTTIRNSSSASADTEPFNFGGAFRIVIRDLTVSAGGSIRTTSDAIDFDQGNDSLVERVKISSSRGKGIIFDGKDAGWNSSGNTVRNCVIDGTPNDAIQFLASTNNRVEGCTITNIAADGIEATKSSTQAAQPNKKSNDNVIIGNTIDNVGENGIKIQSSDRNRVSGNRITNSSDDTSGKDGIRISSTDSITCNDNIVEGNTATDTQATKTQAYGLNIDSPLCNRTQVGTNDFAGNKTGTIRDNGTNTQYGSSDTTPPNAPSGLTATAVSATRVDLSWTASSSPDVTGYEIQRNGAFLANVGKVTAYSDTTAAPATTYQYRLRARDGAGNLSGFSNTASVTTPAAPDTQPPTTPTNLSATAVSSTRVDLSWTASTDNVGVTGYEIQRNGAFLANVGKVTAYSDTTAAPATTYQYRLRARDGAGNLSGFSNTASVTTPAAPDTQPPTTPTNLSATAVSSTRVDLSWTASTDNVGVTGYEIFRNGAFLANVGAVTTYSDTTASSATTYSYQVRARDAAGNRSGFSNTASVTTPDTQPPTAPANLTASAVSSTRVDLSWTASTDNVGVTGYEIFRNGASLANVGTVTTYSDTTASSATTYSYQVRARDAAGNRSGFSNTATVTTPAPQDFQPPTTPTNLTATAVNSTRVDLSWTAATDNVGVTGYEIFRNGAPIAAVGAVTTYSDTTVSPLSFYEYMVRARDAAGNRSGFSNTARAITPPQSDFMPPTTPANLQATAASPTRVDLSWAASSDNVGVTGYEIFRDGAALDSIGAVTTYSDTTVSPLTSYSYQVRARDGAGNRSALSDPATATTPAPALFADGFETGNFSNWTSNTGLVAQQQHVYAGSWAARGTTTSAARYAYRQLDTTHTELYYRVRFKVISQGGGTTSGSTISFLKLRTGSGTSILGLFRNTTGHLGYRNDVAGASTTSSTVVTTGVWHEVQVRLRISGASGQSETWFDGVRVAALSKTENFGTAPIGRLQLGENSTGRTFDFAFDEVAASTFFVTS